jgi:carbonic anhydrase
MHVVMNDPTGNKHAVLAFCLEKSVEPNGFFEDIMTLLDGQDKATIVPGWTSPAITNADLSALQPIMDSSYIKYMGSYTTPACNLDIKWYMFTSKVPVPVRLLEFIDTLFPQEDFSTSTDLAVSLKHLNHRPLQPTQGRQIDLVEVCNCNGLTDTRRHLLFASTPDDGCNGCPACP